MADVNLEQSGHPDDQSEISKGETHLVSSKYVRIRAFLENGTLYQSEGWQSSAFKDSFYFKPYGLFCWFSKTTFKRARKRNGSNGSSKQALSLWQYIQSRYVTYFLDTKYYSTPENCLFIFWWFTTCPKKYIKDRRMTDRVFIRIQCNFSCLAGYAYPFSLKSNDQRISQIEEVQTRKALFSPHKSAQ